MKVYKEEYWIASTNYGTSNCGPFNTFEEAVEDAIKQYKKSVDGYATDLFDDYEYNDLAEHPEDIKFYIGNRSDFVPFVDEDHLLYAIDEQASDFFGEWYDWSSYFDITQEQREELREELQKVYDAWEEKYKHFTNNFMLTDVCEVCIGDCLNSVSQSKE